MPQRDVRACIEDARAACERIRKWTADRSLTDYRDDDLLRAAIERQFEIVGEALNNAAKIRPDVQREVPEARQVVDFRNFLIHGYHLVDHEVVWQIIRSDLPTLERRLESLRDAL